MMNRYAIGLTAATLLVILTACDGAGADGSVALGRRYVDSLHGFSLRPPADTERKRDPSKTRLVSWSRRDPKTRAIAWTLSVHRATESNKKIDIGPYSKALAEKLRREDNFNVDSLRLAPVAGKEAIHFSGQTGGVTRMWQRQAWVYRGEGRFLIIDIRGPLGRKDQMDSVCRKVLGTLQLTDPDAAMASRVDRLRRGREFLATLNDRKLSAALCREGQWFLLRLKGKDVGFMYTVEAAVKREGVNGYEVASWVMMQLPKDEPRLLKRKLFTTPDLLVERWTERLQIGSGAKAVNMAEDGIKQAELIVCNIARGGQVHTRKKKVPKDIYLPRAVGMMLPRLIDLTAPAEYAFASYTTEANDFDMRSFIVVGPEQITIDHKRVEAIRVLDQPAADAETATLWFDSRGRLLRMQSEDGLEMAPSTRPNVVKLFPKAVSIIRALGK